jgi:hypothetical protein
MKELQREYYRELGTYNNGNKKGYVLVNVHVLFVYRLLSLLALTILTLMFFFPPR